MSEDRKWEQRIDALVEKMQEKVASEGVSPLERALKTWSFQDPDRLLVSFAVFSPTCVGVTDVSTREYYTDPLKMYYTQAVGAVEWGNEIPLMYGDAYNIEYEALGGKLLFPEDSMPAIHDPLLLEKSDLARLRVPDPERDGRMPYILSLCALHQEKLGKLVFAPCSCCGPFSLAVGLRGYRNLLRDIKKDPLFVHELLEFCTEVVITYGKKLIEVHKATPTIQEAWSCLPNVSPPIFTEFCFPYITRCVEALKTHAGGFAGTLFYAWGTSLAPSWQSMLRTICATGISALPLTEEEIRGQRGYGEVDLAEFKAITRSHRTVLMTFVHIDTLTQGTPDEIRALVREWFGAAGPGSGFCISTTLPVGVPRENFDAFAAAVRGCTYPVKD